MALTMWLISVSWPQYKCTWKALCSWCILWGRKYIFCSAPLSSGEWKIKNVDQQTRLLIISEGHVFTVQYCWYSAAYRWAVTHRLYQNISFHTPDRVTLADTVSSLHGHFGAIFFVLQHHIGLHRPYDRAQWTHSEEEPACFTGWCQSRGWHTRLQPQAVVFSEVNSVLVKMNSLWG